MYDGNENHDVTEQIKTILD